MAVPGAFTPYTTIEPYLGTLPGYASGDDATRLAAYTAYEKMYWNVKDTFKVIQRGTNTTPIYVPSARVLVETTNRFFAKGFNFAITPSAGTPADQLALRMQLTALFRREHFFTKFRSNKRFGLIRGDSILHVVADPTKPQGRRISIYEVDPGAYFPIHDPNDLDKLLGCHIIEQSELNGKTLIKRQTYRKVITPNAPTQITSETALYETSGWDDRDAGQIKLVQQLRPVTPLPPQITALPVYHVRNMHVPSDPFGSSELRGLERLMAAINQSMSDEELTLALDGIGMYATTSGPPVDDDGNETDWVLGPGRVIEHAPGTEFGRVSGVTNLSPFREHLDALTKALREAGATPDIAVGRVDVAVAQSGIALSLEMGPLLAKNEEKEDELLGVHDHFFYDLQHGWLPAYEQADYPDCDVVPVVGDPLPEDRAAKVNEIIALATNMIISVAYAQSQLAELGYEFPANMAADIVAEQEAMRAARYPDTFSARLDAELNALTGANED